MDNEFLKVLNEPKAVLLLARMQWKEQWCTFESFRFPKNPVQ